MCIQRRPNPIKCVNKNIPRRDLLQKYLSTQSFRDYVDGLHSDDKAAQRGARLIASSAPGFATLCSTRPRPRCQEGGQNREAGHPGYDSPSEISGAVRRDSLKTFLFACDAHQMNRTQVTPVGAHY